MSPHCAPKKIYLVRLKITPFRFERVKQFIQCWKDDFCLCTSYLAADYIVTGLKSPFRIVRNVKQSTCPVVHMNWLLKSLCSNKVLDPDKYRIDMSVVRATDVPLPHKSLPSKPLPRQVKWSQLADMHNKALVDSGIITTFQLTAASEKRRHYAHKRKDKSKKREKNDSNRVQYTKEEHTPIKEKAIATTEHEDAHIKQETEYAPTCNKSTASDMVKQEPVDEDCTFHSSLNKSCSSSLDFEQQPSSLTEITT